MLTQERAQTVPATRPAAAVAARPRAGAVELIISWLLRVGVWSSITIIAAGLVILLVTDHAALTRHYPGGPTEILKPHPHGLSDQPDPFTSYGDVFRSLADGQAYGVIALGLFVLLLTPILRVGISIVAFAIERDRLYVAITTGVLLLLMTGVLLGRAGG